MVPDVWGEEKVSLLFSRFCAPCGGHCQDMAWQGLTRSLCVILLLPAPGAMQGHRGPGWVSSAVGTKCSEQKVSPCACAVFFPGFMLPLPTSLHPPLPDFPAVGRISTHTQVSVIIRPRHHMSRGVGFSAIPHLRQGLRPGSVLRPTSARLPNGWPAGTADSPPECSFLWAT